MAEDEFFTILGWSHSYFSWASKPFKWTFTVLRDRASSMFGNFLEYFSPVAGSSTRLIHVDALKVVDYTIIIFVSVMLHHTFCQRTYNVFFFIFN